jgi:hypothetical protein
MRPAPVAQIETASQAGAPEHIGGAEGNDVVTAAAAISHFADPRTFTRLKEAVRCYQDPAWRKQNRFTKAQAAVFLRQRHPSLAVCPLDLDQLGKVLAGFPSHADWASRGFDPLLLWHELHDPVQRQARRQPMQTARAAMRQECRQFVAERLKDRLLLAIRGGDWHLVHPLVELVRGLAPSGLAKKCFCAGGGDPDTSADVQEAQGSYRLLEDALALCRREKLAELRTTPAGEREVRSTPRLDPHFAVCSLFQDLVPRAPGEQARLEELLLAEGCRDPLIVWQSRRLLIDGHQRYTLCALLGRPYRIVFKEFADEAAACQYLWDLHDGRRSYSDLLRSYRRGKQYLALGLKRGGNRRNGRSTNCTLMRMEELDQTPISCTLMVSEATDQTPTNCTLIGARQPKNLPGRTASTARRSTTTLTSLAP